jgi:hypothetical protein
MTVLVLLETSSLITLLDLKSEYVGTNREDRILLGELNVYFYYT